jgi:replicative DNA helicase
VSALPSVHDLLVHFSAERSLLGALLIDGALLARIDGLQPEQFASEHHRVIFEAIRGLADRGEGVDLVTVQSELERTWQLERAGGAAVLSALVDRVPDVENVESYGRAVCDASRRRRLLADVGRECRALAGGARVEDFTANVTRTLAAVAVPAEDGEAASWIDIGRFREELRQITRTRVSTGIPTLDRATEGGISGDMVVLFVGPVGSGKSTFAGQLSRGHAKKHGGRVYVYAPDQGGSQYLKRIASTFGNVAEDDDAFARFVAGVVPVLRVIDERKDGVTIESFRDLVLAAGDVAAVIIDTPQTVATLENEEERQRIQKATGIARDLTSGLLVPVYVCSHANRASTAARNKQDRTLARSAGLGDASLEHRAQVMLFMERRDGQDVTEIDVEIPKAAIANLKCRLLLDVETWTLREIDVADDSGQKAEQAKTVRLEKQNTARTERREAIMAVVLGGPADAGSSFSRILEKCGGRTQGLKPTLDVMVEEGLLETLPGLKPKTGGPTPKHYRIKQAPVLSRVASPPVERTIERSFLPPVPLEVRGKNECSPFVPDLSESSFSTGKNDGKERPEGGTP